MKKVCLLVCALIIVCVLCLFCFVACNDNKKPIEPSGDTVVTDAGAAAKADVRSITINEEASQANRIVNIVYPSIQSFNNKNFQKSINDEITSVILAYRNEISTIIDEETPATALYTYKVNYDKYTHGDYLSLVISNDYQTGGIRSNVWKDIYNIDVKKERILYLNDIFPSNVDYEEIILKEIAKQAEKENYKLMNGEGLDDIPNNQKFYIKDEKLIIYFDAAEIAPATYGVLQFEMPFTLGEDGLFRP